MKFEVKDINLEKAGAERVSWAEKEMPVLARLKTEFTKKQSFKGVRIAACLHVTKETAVLMNALKAGGAQVALCGSNPLSTQDDVAAALVKNGISVFAWRGIGRKDYYDCLQKVMDIKPHITIDDGADLISLIHTKRQELLSTVWAGQEETTTGVIRLRSMAKDGALKYPVIAVNDTPTKHMFDNHYGTGQSTMDALMRSTNMLIPGKKLVVAGYGFCGSGIAAKARGLGAHVIVTEVDAIKALKAVMDGFQVLSMNEAVKIGEVFISATGNMSVITLAHLKAMRDGAIVANAGHFNVEIDVEGLQKTAKRGKKMGEAQEYLFGKKRVYLLAEGRLVNLAAAEGHPSSVMDMSFAGQALVSQWLVKNYKNLENRVYEVPVELDARIASLKLESMGVKIDTLTPKQTKYLSSWEEGT